MLDKEALRTEIEEAFRGVNRVNGVSWRETNEIDNCESEAKCLAARQLDTDTSWQQVVVSKPWLQNWGSLAFIDAIGFCYYLPAMMGSTLESFENTFELSLDFYLDLDLFDREHYLEKWSRFNDRQRKCVALFLQFSAGQDEECTWGKWQKALDSYWKQYLSC